MSSIAGKMVPLDNMGHDFSQKPHTLCAVCNEGVVIHQFFHPMNGLHFVEPPPPPGNSGLLRLLLAIQEMACEQHYQRPIAYHFDTNLSFCNHDILTFEVQSVEVAE